MYYHQSMDGYKRHTQRDMLLQIAACLLFLFIVGLFVFAYVEFSKRYSLPIDIDFADGDIFQVYVTHPDSTAFNIHDKVVAIDGVTVSALKKNNLTEVPANCTVTLVDALNTVREETMRSLPPTPLMLFELLFLPLLGVIFVIPGLVMPFVRLADRSVILFFLFGFFIAIFTSTSQLSRLRYDWVAILHFTSVILATWSYIEFHYAILEFHPTRELVWLFRAFKIGLLVFLVYAFIADMVGLQKELSFAVYVDIILSFVYVLVIFLSQLHQNEFRKGVVRALFLTNITAVLPLMLFSYIPLSLERTRYVPIIIVTLPLLLIPVNYSLLLSNRKGWLRIAIPTLSFILTLSTGIIFFIQIGKWFPHFPPNIRSTNWIAYLENIIVLLLFLLVYQGFYRLLSKVIYGDINQISRNLLREGFIMRQQADIESSLVQMGRVFMCEFYRYSYLNICLVDGTVLQFDADNQLKVLQFDDAIMRKLVERIAARHILHTTASHDDRVVSIETIELVRDEFPQIFGDDPRYCYLLYGSKAPIGFIVAGDRRAGEPFDAIEMQQLQLILNQFQMIVENLLLLQQLEKSSQQLRLSGQQMIQMREYERRRIARDMHDNIIQAITAFRLQLNELYDSDKLTISDIEADELQHNLLTITQDIRDICFNLRPPALDATGIESAVVSLVESYHADNSLLIDVNFEGREILNLLSEDIAICLYRVLQEALLNITRHAGIKFAHVTLLADENQVKMKIADEGKGFAVPDQINELVNDGHFGLLGAQEFLDTVNGTFVVESKPGKGAVIETAIPLTKEEGENGIFYDYRR